MQNSENPSSKKKEEVPPVEADKFQKEGENFDKQPDFRPPENDEEDHSFDEVDSRNHESPSVSYYNNSDNHMVEPQ